MKKILINIGFVLALFSMLFTSCEEVEPEITEIEFERVFSPINLTARIRNMTAVELSWDIRDNVESYVVEISEDSLEFKSIIKTAEVTPDKLPYTAVLDGETQYSARIKGVSEGVADSKWSTIVFKTAAEDILPDVLPEDMDAKFVTLRWPAESEVTHFVINPGNVNRPITEDEVAAGAATITGLTGSTEYTVTLFRNDKRRGQAVFTTLIDVGNATRVYPEDDLSAVIAAAEEGETLVLYPGDYLVYSGKITIDKSISIIGLYPHEKPLLHVQFILENAVQSVEVKDVEMTGMYIDSDNAEAILDHAFQYGTDEVSYGSLSVVGCNIHDYNKSLFSAASSPNAKSSVESIVLDNSIVTNILTNSADFIDFRNGHVKNLKLMNSTFNNCAPGRDFIRLDDSSGSFPSSTSNVEIDHCTFYGVSNTDDRLLYVRFVENRLKVSNSIFAATTAYYTNQAKTAQPECSRNNYFNAPAFLPGGSSQSNAKYDLSSNYTTLDPGFADPENGDFTISNQDLIDDSIGDPRWLP